MFVFSLMEWYINSVCFYVWISCLFDLIFFHTKSQHVMLCQLILFHIMSDFVLHHVVSFHVISIIICIMWFPFMPFQYIWQKKTDTKTGSAFPANHGLMWKQLVSVSGSSTLKG